MKSQNIFTSKFMNLRDDLAQSSVGDCLNSGKTNQDGLNEF